MSRPRGRGTNGGAGRGPHRAPRRGRTGGGGGKRRGCLFVAVDLAAYLWSSRQGRTAVLCALIGGCGLVFHFWTAYPLLLALDLPRPVLRTRPSSGVRAGLVPGVPAPP